MSQYKKQCFIIDGNSFMHRAFTVLPPFFNKEGFPTGAITGFLSMVNSIIKKHNPDKLIITFDAKGKTFRHDIFPEYKANRNKTDFELSQQFLPIKDILTAWGYPIVSIEGVEADDVMATLAKMANKAGFKAIICTSDKDMGQEVNEDVFILDTKDSDNNPEPYGPEGVFKKMGVYPDRVVDLLAIEGDKIDNVPGVFGVGNKTAVKWINEYGCLQGILDNSGKLKGAFGDKFRSSISDVVLSYTLVSLVNNLDLGLAFDDIAGEQDKEKLFELVKKYELKGFQKAIGLIDENAEEVDEDILYALDENTLTQLISLLKKNNEAHVEFHVAEKGQDDVSPITLFVSSKTIDGIYVVELDPDNLTDQQLILLDYLLSSQVKIIGFEVKEVLKLIARISGGSIKIKQKNIDLRIAYYVDEGKGAKHIGLDVINDKCNGIKLSPLRIENKLNTDKPKWKKIQREALIGIKSEEVILAKNVRSSDALSKTIMNSAIFDLEMSVVQILGIMEVTGVQLDIKHLNKLDEEFTAKLKAIEANIFAISGSEFNIASAKKVAKVLFEDLAIESKKKSTGEEVLSGLVDKNPICGMILSWRSLSKLKSTYIDGLLSHATDDGIVHTTFNQTVTNTSRLSSSEPNLQNIPIKSEEGRKIRESFIARNGYKVTSFDYSQIELRIMAELSQEPVLIEAFKKGLDIHVATASDIYDVALDDVTPEQRRSAKAINFGLIYGRGAKATAAELGISVKESKELIERYFVKYKKIRPYLESVLQFAKENLFVLTHDGRVLATRDINTNNPMARNHNELAAKNAPLQGTAADVIKKAMVASMLYLEENPDLDVNLLIQVHDELIFEVREDQVDVVGKALKDIMESSSSMDVVLDVDFGVGDNWLEAH